MHKARVIANEFLERAEDAGRSLTPMQLQKLVYFAHGWHLAIFERPLIDEPVQAWTWGPVISDLYHEFKKFGASSIENWALLSRFEMGNPPTGESAKLIDKIWEVYRGFTGPQMSAMTHKDGTPWSEVWQSLTEANPSPISGNLIENKKIAEHFVSLAASNN